jgi:hypothetical protein
MPFGFGKKKDGQVKVKKLGYEVNSQGKKEREREFYFLFIFFGERIHINLRFSNSRQIRAVVRLYLQRRVFHVV